MANKTSKYSLPLLVVLLSLILTIVSFKIFNLFYIEQNSPYMDEVFHIPQAQWYCKDQWTKWNPKITTLPGLYLVSYVLLKPFEKLGYGNFCTVYLLRLTNVIATIFNFYLAFLICCSLERKYKSKSKLLWKLLTALNISIFPPLYFFSFLYYTDVWSVTFILLLYQSHLCQWKALATISSVMAVLMRQTNIVWVLLMILDEAWNVIAWSKRKIAIQDYQCTVSILKEFASDYLNFWKRKKSLWSLMIEILAKTSHYIIVCLLFVTFVILNGGIVLGDKQAHKPTFHPMQYLYFLDITGFFALGFFLSESLTILRDPPKLLVTLLLVGLFATASEYNKVEHPYLLADNRHLSFYLWRKIFGFDILRRELVLSYVLCALLLYRLLRKRCHFMFIAAMTFCAIVNLTPQHLFELRYYIVPFILYRIHFKQNFLVLLETILFVIINAIVIHLFLHHPFSWASQPGTKQRFLW